MSNCKRSVSTRLTDHVGDDTTRISHVRTVVINRKILMDMKNRRVSCTWLYMFDGEITSGIGAFSGAEQKIQDIMTSSSCNSRCNTSDDNTG